MSQSLARCFVALACLLAPVAAASAQFTLLSARNQATAQVGSSDPRRTSDQWSSEHTLPTLGMQSASNWGAINALAEGRPLGSSEYRIATAVQPPPLGPCVVSLSGMTEVYARAASGASTSNAASAAISCSVTFEVATTFGYMLGFSFDGFADRGEYGGTANAQYIVQLWSIDANGDWATRIFNEYSGVDDGARTRDYFQYGVLEPGRYALGFILQVDCWAFYSDVRAVASGHFFFANNGIIPAPGAGAIVLAIFGGIVAEERGRT